MPYFSAVATRLKNQLFNSRPLDSVHEDLAGRMDPVGEFAGADVKVVAGLGGEDPAEVEPGIVRSEEHTSELQSLY